MGSPISAFIAEAVLQRLESLVFQHHRPKFWARYVDDTFVVIERDQVLTFKEHLNAVFPDIQFTMDKATTSEKPEDSSEREWPNTLQWCEEMTPALKLRLIRRDPAINSNSTRPKFLQEVTTACTRRALLYGPSCRSKALQRTDWQNGCSSVSNFRPLIQTPQSTQFLEKLKGDLAIETVELLLRSKYNETENHFGHAQVLQLLKFCLRTYFLFDGTIYEQGGDNTSRFANFWTHSRGGPTTIRVAGHPTPQTEIPGSVYGRYLRYHLMGSGANVQRTSQKRLPGQATYDGGEREEPAGLPGCPRMPQILWWTKDQSVQKSDEQDASTEIQEQPPNQPQTQLRKDAISAC
ncbi:hypothetical protein SprV_0501773900 [Sparganum proliferum]